VGGIRRAVDTDIIKPLLLSTSRQDFLSLLSTVWKDYQSLG